MAGKKPEQPKESLNKCWLCNKYMKTQILQQREHNIKIHYCSKCDIVRK
jgi:hypothetical protein